MSAADKKKMQGLLNAHIDLLSKTTPPFKDTGRVHSRTRLDDIGNSTERFKRTYLPHYLDAPSATFHDDLDAMVRYPEKALFIVHGPREHAKSVQCRINILEGVLNGSIQYWVFAAEKVNQAYQHIDSIFVELAENYRILEDYQIKIIKYDSINGIFRAQVTRKADGKRNQFQLQAVSDGTSGKGLLFFQYRPQGALVDDLEKLLDTYNPINGKRKNAWVRQELFGAITGPLVWLGNMGRKTSALYQGFEEIYTNEDDFKKIREAGSVPGLFAKICARNGGKITTSDGLRLQRGFIFRADRMVNGALSYLWPERFSVRHYDSERRVLGFRYEGEMNGNPISPSEIFKIFPTYNDEELTKALQSKSHVIYTWLDPAWGRSKSSAYKCWITVLFDGHYWYVLDAYCRQGTSISEAIDHWYQSFERWEPHGLRVGGFEKTFAQDERFKQDLMLAEEKHGKMLPVYPEDNPGEKFARIESSEGVHNSGRVLWPARISPDVATVKEQHQLYPDHIYVDGPDALEAAITRARRRLKSNQSTFESFGSRRFTKSRR